MSSIAASSPLLPISISVSWPRVRTRASRECRSRGLWSVSPWFPTHSISCLIVVPGPLTFRMMLRVVSSMNSTRTWVTPPREPVSGQNVCSIGALSGFARTGTAEDCEIMSAKLRSAYEPPAHTAGDLDELDGDLGGIHVCGLPPLATASSPPFQWALFHTLLIEFSWD